MKPTKRISERIYVKVSSDTDKTGHVQPTTIITWDDGRIFKIDSVLDFRPAASAGNNINGDCFTVMIGEQERHLYYEPTDTIFAGRRGRWFVEIVLKLPLR